MKTMIAFTLIFISVFAEALPAPVDFWTQAKGAQIVLDATQQAEFFAFASQHPIRTLYLDISGIQPLTRDISQSTPARLLKEFLVSANQQGMQVELHLGRTDEWVFNPANAQVQLQTVLTYISSLKLQFGQQIVVHGIHLDIEYFGLPGWSDPVTGGVIRQKFLDLLDLLGPMVRAAGLALVLDIDPFDEGPPLLRGQVTKGFFEWIVDAADRFAIMEYQNNPNLTIQGADVVGGVKDFVSLVSQAGKKAEIGFLVGCGGFLPATRSFCGLGETQLLNAMSLISTAFLNESSFDQFAIFQYGSYGDLNP